MYSVYINQFLFGLSKSFYTFVLNDIYQLNIIYFCLVWTFDWCKGKKHCLCFFTQSNFVNSLEVNTLFLCSQTFYIIHFFILVINCFLFNAFFWHVLIVIYLQISLPPFQQANIRVGSCTSDNRSAEEDWSNLWPTRTHTSSHVTAHRRRNRHSPGYLFLLFMYLMICNFDIRNCNVRPMNYTEG